MMLKDILQTYIIPSEENIDPDVFRHMTNLGCFKDKEKLVRELLSSRYFFKLFFAPLRNFAWDYVKTWLILVHKQQMLIRKMYLQAQHRENGLFLAFGPEKAQASSWRWNWGFLECVHLFKLESCWLFGFWWSMNCFTMCSFAGDSSWLES